MKYCLNCGKELKSNKNKFCNNVCCAKFQHTKYIENWKLGKISGVSGFGVSKHIRTYLLEKHNYSCQECGWNKINPFTNRTTLEIHHKDGNYLNCSEENLALLCPNCHSLTENYKSLNRPKLRRDRTKYQGRPNFSDELDFKLKETKKYYCSICGVEITRGAKLCVPCYKEQNAKLSKKPSKEELIQKYNQIHNFVQLGKYYGVSDSAVRKWMRSYNIDYKSLLFK